MELLDADGSGTVEPDELFAWLFSGEVQESQQQLERSLPSARRTKALRAGAVARARGVGRSPLGRERARLEHKQRTATRTRAQREPATHGEHSSITIVRARASRACTERLGSIDRPSSGTRCLIARSNLRACLL